MRVSVVLVKPRCVVSASDVMGTVQAGISGETFGGVPRLVLLPAVLTGPIGSLAHAQAEPHVGVEDGNLALLRFGRLGLWGHFVTFTIGFLQNGQSLTRYFGNGFTITVIT